MNNHDWPRAIRLLGGILESSGGFTVDVSTSPAAGAPQEDRDRWRPQFVKYDVVLSHSGHRRLLRLVEDGEENAVEEGSPYWTEMQVFDAKSKPVEELLEEGGYFEMVLPQALLEAKPKSLTIGRIDFYR
jgi:hypothetical protein